MTKPPPPMPDEVLFQVAPPWECTDKAFVREVKANLMAAMMGTWPERSHASKFSVRALQLINARLAPRLVKLHVVWKEGDTYEDICRRRLDLLNGLYPEW